MDSRNCPTEWMGTRSSPENLVPGVHDLHPIAQPLMWHIPKRVLFLCSNSQERKSDWPNYLWPRGQSGSIVAMGLAFVVVDISNAGALVDSQMKVSCCHKTSVAETGFDFRFDSKSSAFLLPKGRLIKKHMDLASTFFSGSPHHHHHHVRHSCVGSCCFHSCIRYLLVSDAYMAASWFLSVHWDSMSCGLASHSAHSCQVSDSPHTTLTCSTINILLTCFIIFLSIHLSIHSSIHFGDDFKVCFCFLFSFL